MEPLLKSTITKGQDAISKAWSSATNESNKSRSIFGLGLCVGLLSALMISSIFSSRSREITSEAWVLTVTLRFKTVADKESFNGFFVPLSQFVRKTETGCLSYIVSESDKDPKQLLILERYINKDEYLKVHKTSKEFLLFREKLAQMQAKGRVAVDGQSYKEFGVGYIN